MSMHRLQSKLERSGGRSESRSEHVTLDIMQPKKKSCSCRGWDISRTPDKPHAKCSANRIYFPPPRSGLSPDSLNPPRSAIGPPPQLRSSAPLNDPTRRQRHKRQRHTTTITISHSWPPLSHTPRHRLAIAHSQLGLYRACYSRLLRYRAGLTQQRPIDSAVV